jgi:hypothetical protein
MGAMLCGFVLFLLGSERDPRQRHWDGYLSSLVEISLAVRDGASPDLELLDENRHHFRELIVLEELVPLHYDWDNPQDVQLLDEFTTHMGADGPVMTWRGGTALMGRQWPVGIANVLRSHYRRLPIGLRENKRGD